MNINFMTWNTRLYMKGNRVGRNQEKIDFEKYKDIIEIIKIHVNKKNGIAILQEIPYKSNITRKEHELFVELKNDFPKDQYSLIYNVSNQNQIKMTVVIAKNEVIQHNKDGLNNNCCVSFLVNKTDLNVLGVHSHNAFELREWLPGEELFNPNIMLGDFNSGNYIKEKNDNKIMVNRKNYLMLTEGYIDICQGEYTHHIYKTHIDHILLKNNNGFHEKYKYKNVKVDREVILSDHYPLYCEITMSN